LSVAPATLTVTAGTTVTWKNEDDSPHRIGDKSGTFTSAALDTDDTFSHTYSAPGEYPYICTIHPYMVGKIIVKPGGKSVARSGTTRCQRPDCDPTDAWAEEAPYDHERQDAMGRTGKLSRPEPAQA
jgi:hypothetical protein